MYDLFFFFFFFFGGGGGIRGVFHIVFCVVFYLKNGDMKCHKTFILKNQGKGSGESDLGMKPVLNQKK